MKRPELNFQKHILKPLYKLKHDILTPAAFKKGCQNMAEFIYKYSKETALIMLGFNAISILSSHISQIGGLKRSNRENKDYLITQERNELILDTVFTVIPPFLIDNFLKKKIDGGEIITKEFQNKMVNYVAPCVGACKEDLFYTEHLIPVKEQLASISSRVLGSLINNKKVPNNIKEKLKNLKVKAESVLPEINTHVPHPSIEDFVIDFEERTTKSQIPPDILKNFYHGSAFDDIWGMRNGLLIMATLGYTVLASCILTPILKNIMSNRSYDRYLKKKGETKDSIKRKSRFSFANIPIDTEKQTDLFSPTEFTPEIREQVNLRTTPLLQPPKREIFNTFYNTSSQSKGLRI